MPRRILVGYGIDVDAVSGWINTRDGSTANPTDVSRGIFGATVGVDRLLRLWDKYNIKTTWFIPAHSIESFPKQMAKIRDAGHEIGLHGYTHEHVSTLSTEQEADVLKKSISVLTSFTGKRPVGWTAPAWSTSSATATLLQSHDILYDHSFMHHDSQPYYLPYPPLYRSTNLTEAASTWMKPMRTLEPSSVVEIPANWHLDDWPPFQLNLKQPSTHGFVDPHVIERMWKEQFEFSYREGGDFIFVMSIHPQVSGKPQVIMMHERLIEWINGFEGVEWCTAEQMAREFKEGRIKGAVVEGGSDDW